MAGFVAQVAALFIEPGQQIEEQVIGLGLMHGLFERAATGNRQEQAALIPQRDSLGGRAVLVLLNSSSREIDIGLFVCIGRCAFEVLPKAEGAMPSG